MPHESEFEFSLRLQPALSYDQHLGWNMSRRAYAADGPESWRSGDVPQGISSNAAFAAMQARLLWEAVGAQGERTVHVLELGGGTGAFAWHFIQAFEALAAGSEFRINYLLSDPVAANLAGLATNPYFEPLIDDGRLRLAVADLLSPGHLRDLWNRPLTTPAFDLITISYVLCHQSFRLVVPEADGCRERLVSSDWTLKLPGWARGLKPQLTGALRDLGHMPDRAELEALLPLQALPQLTAAQHSELLDALARQTRAVRLQLRSETAATAWSRALSRGEGPDWLLDAIKDWPQACILVPEQGLNGLQGWVDTLAPDGLLLISDKGWADAEGHRQPPQPSRHGAHLAWPVHFPLLTAWARAKGLTAAQTDHPLWPLHSLLAIKGDTGRTSALLAHFEAAWNQRNANIFAAELVDSAAAAEAAGDARKAAMLYLQALEHRPGEAGLMHDLVGCLIELQAFELAADWLNRPCQDLFGSYDFAFQHGQLCLFGGSPTGAIEAFEASLRDHGPDPATWYNLGLSQMLAHRHSLAHASFKAALALDPGHELARAALDSWDETFAP